MLQSTVGHRPDTLQILLGTHYAKLNFNILCPNQLDYYTAKSCSKSCSEFKREPVTMYDTQKTNLTAMSSQIRYFAAQWLKNLINGQRQKTVNISQQDVEATSKNFISDVLFNEFSTGELGVSKSFGETPQTLTALSHYQKNFRLKFTFQYALTFFSDLCHIFDNFFSLQDCEIKQLHDKMFQKRPRQTDYTRLLDSNDDTKSNFRTKIRTMQNPVSNAHSSFQAESVQIYEVTI